VALLKCRENTLIQNQFKVIRDRLSASYWFIPFVMLAATVLLAFFMLWLDLRVQQDLVSFPFASDPEVAQDVLSSIAGSMIAVAGTVFSITLVVLTLAAQQFGPSVMDNFMRDRVTQVALGLFVSTFLYSLIVLAMIVREPIGTQIPQLSIIAGAILTLITIGGLVYYIHHISEAIRVPNILANIGAQVHDTIDSLYPDQLEETRTKRRRPERPHNVTEQANAIMARNSGYLSNVDGEQLLKICLKHDLYVHVQASTGDFVTGGAQIIEVSPAGNISDDVRNDLLDALTLHDTRSNRQDLAYMLDKYRNIAARALSTGVNAPNSARMCLDRLGEAFVKLAGRQMPIYSMEDENGKTRVIMESASFPPLLESSFGPLAHDAANQALILRHMLDVLITILNAVKRKPDYQAVSRQIELVNLFAQQLPKALRQSVNYPQRYEYGQSQLEKAGQKFST
jgi:uncharacterized membrane protein